MPIIHLETTINAELEICFDLATSIDLHKISTAKTNEKAIDGVTTGLIGLNDFVTWEARHFGFQQRLSSKITEYERPFHFRDEQLKGAFKFIVHDHDFKVENGMVVMTDVFRYAAPYGIAGKLIEKLLLTNYLKKLLIERNAVIKDFAETGKYANVLKPA